MIYPLYIISSYLRSLLLSLFCLRLVYVLLTTGFNTRHVLKTNAVYRHIIYRYKKYGPVNKVLIKYIYSLSIPVSDVCEGKRRFTLAGKHN